MTIEADPSSLEVELAALRAEVARLREEAKHSAQMVRELGEAVAARDSFIAIAGHELRNPMGAILVNVTGIPHVSRTREPIPPWLVTRLASLERQARIFVRRATTLLDVSRITSGQLRLAPEVIDLSSVTREVLENLELELERAHSSLTTVLEPSVRGWWDPVALDQIVYNLVSNAIKYGAGKPIRVELMCDDERATLSVADEGIGISEADRERIFVRFERAVTHRAHGGFGLGLWITQQLVEASGGTIRVTSELGVGSIFTVELSRAVERHSR